MNINSRPATPYTDNLIQKRIDELRQMVQLHYVLQQETTTTPHTIQSAITELEGLENERKSKFAIRYE